tara:strand:- start:112 stop:759 length:648 start_codon:yes stop_codon:yes gene_type:complete
MNSTELKALVKEYFNLVEADVTEVVNEEFAAEETNLEITEETFGEIADINKAFTIKYPGSSLQIGDKVTVVTAEGQEMDAPDGTHELEDGTKIVTKDSVVEKIESADGEKVLAAEEVEEVEIEMEEIIVEVEDETSLEDVVKAIADAVEEQMKSMEVKMAKMEEKMNSFMEAPAAEATVTSTGKDVKTGFSKFDVSSAANSKDMELALNLIKNKK